MWRIASSSSTTSTRSSPAASLPAAAPCPMNARYHRRPCGPNPRRRRDHHRREAVDASPIRRGEGPRAVLCLHGLTGTPYEVAPIAHTLADEGHAVRAPLLAGHDDLESLEDSTWHDWYDTAERELDALLQAREGGTAREVIVLGFSMGALLALRLAALRPADVRAAVALSVPLEIPGWQRPLIEGMARLRETPVLGTLIGLWPKRRGPDVRIEAERSGSPSMGAFPYPALAQLVALQEDVARLLPLVRAPLLLVHGALDHTAPAELSERVAQRVSAERVERVLLPRSFHVLARDLDRERLLAEVSRFTESIFTPASTEHRP